MITQMILAYTVFILIGALPVLAPVIAVVLLATGIMFLVRGGVFRTVIGVVCTGAAAFLGLIIFQVDERIPGTTAFREIAVMAERQQQAQRAYAPDGVLERLGEKKRLCHWEKIPAGWEKKCVDGS